MFERDQAPQGSRADMSEARRQRATLSQSQSGTNTTLPALREAASANAASKSMRWR
jgi:hypothetical protein